MEAIKTCLGVNRGNKNRAQGLQLGLKTIRKSVHTNLSDSLFLLDRDCVKKLWSCLKKQAFI